MSAISKMYSGYYVADRTPHTDSLETFLSLYVFALFQAISIQNLAFQFTNFVDEPKFSH